MEHFSSLVEPKQLVTLNLTSTIFGESPLTVPKFMVDSELNLTHLELTQFPLTLINIWWDNITHATFSYIASHKGLEFLRQASNLEFYHVSMYGLDEGDLINPIFHP